jgi:hypothetical protein
MNQILPKPLMLTVALIQGICLFLLFQSTELNRWPSADPIWLFVLSAFLTAVPTFFLLLIDSQNLHKALRALIPFSIVIISVSAYSGLQLIPTEFVRNETIIIPFILTMGIASFKALMYSQEFCAEVKINYQSFFHNSWRNFLVLGLSLLFTLLFFGILLLWGLLFDVIDIDFFLKMFREEWFFFPAGSLAFAFAIIIFRSLSTIIDSISALLKALIKFLLPLLSGIALIFLLALVVQGFTPLWETNLGSGLVLWLQALILFSVNAVYQGNSRERPYPLAVHRLVYLGVAILPAYSIIALYGLLTRIAQYGLTVQRCWAIFVALVLFFFALGYLWGIIRKKDDWLEALAWVNVRMGGVLLAMIILINSPIASFQKLSTQNQIERLHAGIVNPDSLDVNYFRFSLGRQGYLALEEVKEEYGTDNPRLVERIDSSYRNEFIGMAMPLNQGAADTIMTLDEMRAILQVWPDGADVPDAVLTGMLGINNLVNGPFGAFAAGGPALGPGPIMRPVPVFGSPSRDDNLYAFVIEMNNPDADNNDAEEIIFVRETLQGNRSFYLWALQENQWHSFPLFNFDQSQNLNLTEIIEQDLINAVPPEWNDVEIGGLHLSVPQQLNRVPF